MPPSMVLEQPKEMTEMFENVLVGVKAGLASFRHELFPQVPETLDGDLPSQRLLDHLAPALPAPFHQRGQFTRDFLRQTDG